jgi:hypothetical protein
MIVCENEGSLRGEGETDETVNTVVSVDEIKSFGIIPWKSLGFG